MKLNNKGMTLVELIISVALISIVVGFLFKILLDVKYEKDNPGYAADNQVNRAEIIKTIQTDITKKGLVKIVQSSNKKSLLEYEKFNYTLEISDDSKKLSYIDEHTNNKRIWEIKDKNYKYGDISFEEINSCFGLLKVPVISDIYDDKIIDDIEIFAVYESCETKKYSYLINEILKNPLNEGLPDLSLAADTAEESGLFEIEDNYGTSYYFRGDVDNNYVSFGSYPAGSTINGVTYDVETPMYWRIIRINGNGTIRMIYQGTELIENSKTSGYSNPSIAKINYHNEKSDRKYVGYTYEDDLGNQVDSNIKSVVDSWYEDNLKDDYGKYLADAIFCNDKTLASEESDVYYDSHNRINGTDTTDLICAQQTDRYTVNDKKNGNGYLKYPVALLTADEAALAGAIISDKNYNYYLKNYGIWLMTPAASYEYAHMWILSVVGNISAWNLNEDGVTYHSYFVNEKKMFVQPVINLKPSTLVTGNGTITSPYNVVLN